VTTKTSIQLHVSQNLHAMQGLTDYLHGATDMRSVASGFVAGLGRNFTVVLVT
jgi:hypothetical protein